MLCYECMWWERSLSARQGQRQGDALDGRKESSLDEATTTSAGPQQSRRCEVVCLREWWEGTVVTTSQRAEE